MFFFSSRRRHTRWPRDWSSDVCSSDLAAIEHEDQVGGLGGGESVRDRDRGAPGGEGGERAGEPGLGGGVDGRSEERRVGKECRWRGSVRRVGVSCGVHTVKGTVMVKVD